MNKIFEITYFYQPRNYLYDPSMGTWGYVASLEEAEKIVAYLESYLSDETKWIPRENPTMLCSGSGTRYYINEHAFFESLQDLKDYHGRSIG